jgi:hypothetical protein
MAATYKAAALFEGEVLVADHSTPKIAVVI